MCTTMSGRLFYIATNQILSLITIFNGQQEVRMQTCVFLLNKFLRRIVGYSLIKNIHRRNKKKAPHLEHCLVKKIGKQGKHITTCHKGRGLQTDYSFDAFKTRSRWISIMIDSCGLEDRKM